MGKDTHKFVLENKGVYSGESVNGYGYAEAVKGSNLEDVTFRNFSIVGGYEDCVDVVRGRNYVFCEGDMYAGEARTFVTIKGGVQGIWLEDIVFHGKTKYPWDISLGDHTIYNDAEPNLDIVRKVVLNRVKRVDGAPVRVLCMASQVPVKLNGKYRVYVVPRFIWRTWFWLKRKLRKC